MIDFTFHVPCACSCGCEFSVSGPGPGYCTYCQEQGHDTLEPTEPEVKEQSFIWRVGYREGEEYHTLPSPVFEHREDAQMELWIERDKWLRCAVEFMIDEPRSYYVEATSPDGPAV